MRSFSVVSSNLNFTQSQKSPIRGCYPDVGCHSKFRTVATARFRINALTFHVLDRSTKLTIGIDLMKYVLSSSTAVERKWIQHMSEEFWDIANWVMYKGKNWSNLNVVDTILTAILTIVDDDFLHRSWFWKLKVPPPILKIATVRTTLPDWFHNVTINLGNRKAIHFR